MSACVNGHKNPKRNKWSACMPCVRARRERLRAEDKGRGQGKQHGARGYRITDLGRAALRPRFDVVIKDCSPRCGCGECVMRRLRRRGKLAAG